MESSAFFVFFCGIFPAAFMEVIRFVLHMSASALPILLSLFVFSGEIPTQAKQKL